MYQRPEAKYVSIQEAQQKMENYCAYQDRCHKEVETKLKTMVLIPEVRDQILLHLMQENYLNEERFAKSFARGKFRIKKWGKSRIIRELKQREISAYNIKTALKEIDQQEYMAIFHTVSEKKWEAMSNLTLIKKKKKLIDYLLYRGWESTLIFDKLRELIHVE